MNAPAINEEALKPVARRLKKELKSLEVDKVGVSRHEYGIALKSRFTTLNNEKAVLTALITPGVSPDKNVNLILDATLPESPNLEEHLNALSAFMQQSTALLSPMAMLVDMRTSQIVLRQSQLMGINYPISCIPFFNAVQILIPLIQQTIKSICKMNPAPEDARKMADLLSESFYGALTE
ncbi:hypothetical protein [Parendozoicomonas sp. Alg238-R29]|uniref:hypothetical protein n=1 Tax=Parendozoicomonas sp. Alg238-R29 TaxID=2993446 RepID=UPI00248F146C|nr:hypothetical protein [Parendozoicomonas sp. Alg238-R29]